MSKEMNWSNEVAKWEGVVVDLKSKQAAVAKRQYALAAKRRPHALAAAMGDVSAKNKLSKLTTEDVQLVNDLSDFVSAIAEANERLDAAKAQVEAEIVRERARSARTLLDERVALAKEIDEAVEKFGDAVLKFQKVGGAIGKLSGKQVDVIKERINVGRVLACVTKPLHIDVEGKFYDPDFGRHGLAELDHFSVCAWRDWVDEILGDEAEAA